MADSTTLTLRLSRELEGQARPLGGEHQALESYLAAEAITEYVDANAWQIEEIRKASGRPTRAARS